MWGFHDRELILRTALHRLLTRGVEQDGIQRRWRHQTSLRNQEAGGLTFSEEEWAFEWAEIVRVAASKPRRAPVTSSLKRYSSMRLCYEYLEEVHIFALAHIIRRPIIIISDRVLRNFSGEDIAPIHFGGIYLPLEVSPTQCYKSPMVLAYDASHFSALVANEQKEKAPQSKFARMGGRNDVVIPLVTPDGSLLPVQFVIDPENKTVDDKFAKGEFTPGEFPQSITQQLESYLDVRWIQLNISAVQRTCSPPHPPPDPQDDDGEDYDHLWPVQVPEVRFPAANISINNQPDYQRDLIQKYLEHIRVRFVEDQERRRRLAEAREKEEEAKRLRQPVPCSGPGCEMYGMLATGGLCSRCYQKSLAGEPATNESNGEANSPPRSSSPSSSEDTTDLPPPYDIEVVEKDPNRKGPYHFNPASVGKLDRRQPVPPPSAGSRHQPAPPPSSSSRQQPAPPPSSNSKQQSAPPPSARLSSTAGNMGRPHGSPPSTSPSNSPSRQQKSKPSGWVKKLPGRITGKLEGLVPKKGNNSNGNNSVDGSAGGFVRDNVQPARFNSGHTVDAGARLRCHSAGCEFYGSAETGGYCSKCYESLRHPPPAVTLV